MPKFSEVKNLNNEKKVFSEDFKMKPKWYKKAHEVTCTQTAYLPIQNCPSNLTNGNSNLHQVRINNPSRIIFCQININLIRNGYY